MTLFQFLFPPKRIVTQYKVLYVYYLFQKDVSVPFSSEEDRDERLSTLKCQTNIVSVPFSSEEDRDIPSASYILLMKVVFQFLFPPKRIVTSFRIVTVYCFFPI